MSSTLDPCFVLANRNFLNCVLEFCGILDRSDNPVCGETTLDSFESASTSGWAYCNPRSSRRYSFAMIHTKPCISW